MPEPDYTPLGELLAERVSPLQPSDADYDWALGHLSEGVMRPFAQVAEVIDPIDPYVPWEPIFNLDICPDWALPWLGQAVGVKIPPTATADQARQMIAGLGRLAKGTPAAIRAAGDIFLKPPRTMYFRERDGGDAYALEIVVKDDLLPETDKPLTNWVKNPRPANGAGWTTGSQPAGACQLAWIAQSTPTNKPPSGMAIHATNVGAPVVGTNVNIGTGPVSNRNPLPKQGEFVTAALWCRLVSGVTQVKGGINWYDDLGTLIVEGMGNSAVQVVDNVWKQLYITCPVPVESGYLVAPRHWGAFAPMLKFQTTATAFDLYVACAIADEIPAAGRVINYSDPVIDPTWQWDGAANNSTSHRVPTTIVQSAYGSQIPAGILYRFRTVKGWDYQQMTTEGGKYSAQKTVFSTYQKMSDNAKGT